MTSVAIPDVDDDFTVDVRDFNGVVVALRRPKSFPEESSTFDNDETGRVEWRASPSLCAFLSSSSGDRVRAIGVEVLEVGAGLGGPGLVLWRMGLARRVVTTDGNVGVAADLESSIARNRSMVDREVLNSLGEVTSKVLTWGDGGASVREVLRGERFPLVLASDVVYSALSARGVLELVESTLSVEGESAFVLAYVSRWPHVDRALWEAIIDLRWTVRAQNPATFDDVARAEALEDRPCVFVLTRRAKDGGKRNDDDAITFESSTTRREWMDEDSETLKVTPCDALTESFVNDLAKTLRERGEDIKTLEINFKGPFKMCKRTLDALIDAFGSKINLERVRLRECWLDVGCWRRFGRFLSALTTLRELEIMGEEIDGDVLNAIAGDETTWIKRLRRIKFSRCEKFDAVAASVLRSTWFPTVESSRNVEILDISHCDIADEGLKSLCAILVGMREIHLTHAGISALGVAELARTFCNHRELQELDLSGNDFGESGAAELGDYLSHLSSSLKVLDVRGCNIGDRGLAWLRLDALEVLETLRLGSNGVSDDAMSPLACILRDSNLANTLKSLDLAMNIITWRGAFDLTDAWTEPSTFATENPTASRFALNTLSVRGNHLGDDGVEAIIDAIHSLQALIELDLTDCAVSSAAVTALFAALVNRRRIAVRLRSNPRVDRSSLPPPPALPNVGPIFLFD